MALGNGNRKLSFNNAHMLFNSLNLILYLLDTDRRLLPYRNIEINGIAFVMTFIFW